MTKSSYPQSFEEARLFDAEDPLAQAQSAFSMPDGMTYLVGHSLGPSTHTSLQRLNTAATSDWQTGLVGSWNAADWIDLPTILGAPLANLIGADPEEVVVCDSVSINLYKLVGALIRSRGRSARIIVEAGEFPTDQYILERLSETIGCEFVRVPKGDVHAILQRGDILVQSLVDYRTAHVADVARMETHARNREASIVWDLSHATGVLNLKLKAWGARFGVGCTYKYLNGGPGAPAFMYVHTDALDGLETPLAGWLGHAAPFAFSDHYEAAPGMMRFVAGTPPILSMTALQGALEVFDGIDLAAIERKTQTLGDMCLAAFARLGLPSDSPGIGTRRGGHVSLKHPDGYAISQALAKRGFKTDFRTPDTVRFGLSPLFLSYQSVWRAMEALADILETKAYLAPEFSIRSKVT